MDTMLPTSLLCQPIKKRKVTDFSIKAIMADREEITPAKCGFRKVQSASDAKPREASTPRSMPETPDTTTSDDIIPLPSGQTEKTCSPELANVQCHLEVKELWERFNELGTEMIITRSGRRMFPTIRVSFSGLDSKASYLILMDIVTVDNKRYRYAYHRSSWLVAGKGDPAHQSKLYSHPDSPFLGEQLRKQIITFEKVKLTNTEVNKPGYIVLNSMHRYQPRIHLVLDKGEDGLTKSLKSFADLQAHDYKTFTFPECAFYSVTAYQNQLITKLKIDCNPFAKGFRDSTRVISDMERESMSNGMLPDSTVFQNHVPHEQASDLDNALFAHKLAQISRMIPGSESHFYSTFKPFPPPSPQTSIPLSILQKWSITGWPPGLFLDHPHPHFNMNPMDVSRFFSMNKQLTQAPYLPCYLNENIEILQRTRENQS